MSEIEDIRWKQRFANYNKALKKLSEAVQLSLSIQLSDLEKQGLIQNFEYTHELAWNVMKDYITFQGNAEIKGSRDSTREAFQINLIKDGDAWMDMIKSRNQTSHTYNEAIADEIFAKIVTDYYPVFIEFQKMMQKLLKKENGLQ